MCNVIFKTIITCVIVIITLVFLVRIIPAKKTTVVYGKISHTKQITKNVKVKTLIDVIWCENRSSAKSMRLVFSTIYNRSKIKTIDYLYKESVKPFQFSCLNNISTIKKQTKNKKDIKMYAEATRIVKEFVAGRFKPNINSKFYFAHNKINKPNYLKDKKLLLVFEGHSFY